jgi:sugar/nucleoside kinase (ribokinase family)
MEKHKRTGILAGGNWIIDFVKIIHCYPQENALANILNQDSGNGGAPFNVLKALHKMKVSFPLEGIGVVGNDEKGNEIMRQCSTMGIDCRQIKVLPGVETSYTDVMTVSETGRRTFFHYRGANAFLDTGDFDFSLSHAKIFHLGYLLLLDKLDELGPDGMSGAARVLQQAKKSGFITSADIVSEQLERYTTIIPPSLPFIDILFINELEAKMLTGIELFDAGGMVSVSEAYRAAEAILDMGVLKWVVLHFPEGAIAVSKDGKSVFQPGINVPADLIKGTVGAGDAFAAGVLAGVHENWEMEKNLLLGVSVAARSLIDSNASGSIIAWEECLDFGKSLGYRKCPGSDKIS